MGSSFLCFIPKSLSCFVYPTVVQEMLVHGVNVVGADAEDKNCMEVVVIECDTAPGETEHREVEA